MSNLKYRSDIDGLRAVAVLGVVIYHAFPKLIPGGFIGVDIFFVISGYLISGILYKGHNAGNFSFAEFYARRIRRLFPALITMLVLTMAYGWLVLLPDEFRQLGKHVAAGTLFIQNIVFWQESGYFDTAASLKPLLHLWSLAVEEQFYIFFPPILLLIWKRKWPLAAIMGILLVVSLAGNLWASTHAGSADFFLTPYRAWEFLGGSLLAWWHYDKNHEEDVPLHRNLLSWGGLLLLALGMALIHTGDAYPGWRALLPVAGTLLLMEGGRSAWVNRKILSQPAVVWIGLISYPLYLFHWPVLSFVHIVKGESPKPGYILMALLVSFVMTVMTFYFIEKKIRHHKSKWTVPALVVAFFITGLLGYVISLKFLEPRFHSGKIVNIIKAIQDENMLEGVSQIKNNKNFYVNKVGGNGDQTLFVGDSNMMQYAPRIRFLLGRNTVNKRGAIMITKGGTPPILNTRKNNICESAELFDEVNKQISSNPKIDKIVIAARWTIYFDDASPWTIDSVSLKKEVGQNKAIKSLGESIKKLVEKGKKVTLVLNIPTGWKLDPRNRVKRDFAGMSFPEIPVFYKKDFMKGNESVLKNIYFVGTQNGANVINPLDYLCTNGICRNDDEDGISIYFNEGHLRPGFVRDHVKYLDETVQP